MIDIHSHILYGLDDGAKNIKESLNIAKEAVKEGVEVIYATPHKLDYRYNYENEDFFNRVNCLNELLKKEDVDLKVLPGQEIHVDINLVDLLKKKEVITLGNKYNYVLIELPSSQVPYYTNSLLFDLQLAGYRPIIAHPERNREIIQEPEILYKAVKNGTLSQVTAASVVGKFGKKIQKFSLGLIESNLAHFVASDVHNLANRGFFLQDAWDIINRYLGQNTVSKLRKNADNLYNGTDINKIEPNCIKKKKVFGMF